MKENTRKKIRREGHKEGEERIGKGHRKKWKEGNRKQGKREESKDIMRRKDR